MNSTGISGLQTLMRLLHEYTGAAVQEGEMRVVAEGASGRLIARCVHPSCRGLIGIYWTSERKDNASFLPAADGLRRAGVNVPKVYAREDCGGGRGACLVQDLGEKSLLSLKGKSTGELLEAYRAALRAVHKFHMVQPDWELQPAFDEALYTWEQDYFAEHLLGRHFHSVAAKGFSERAECRAAVKWLAEQERSPVHRDFQSQNIMLVGGDAYLIDFQGMRFGLPEYDLASLLYDPYMDLSEDLRAILLEDALALPGSRATPQRVLACALQRLMQALGAFANIGYNQGNPWYLELIPTGIRILRGVCAAIPSNSPVAPLASCVRSILS